MSKSKGAMRLPVQHLLPVHDTARFGHAFTKAGERLVRVADVLLTLQRPGVHSPGGLPVQPAVYWMHHRLEAASPLAWFVLHLLDWPVAIPPAYRWPQGGYTDTSHDGFDTRGPAGALPWLRQYWEAQWHEIKTTMAYNGHRKEDLFAERLCLRASDVREIFGFEPEKDLSLPTLAKIKAASAPLTAKERSALHERIKLHKPMAKTGRNWPDLPAMLTELLRQYDERMKLPGATQETSEEKLSELWSLKPNTIHDYLKDARTADRKRQASSSSNGEPKTAA